MNIEIEELKIRYQKTKNEDLAAELKISVTTLLKLVKDSGIPMKGKGNPYNVDKINVIK